MYRNYTHPCVLLFPEQLRLRLGDDIGPHQEGELKQWSISGLAKQTFFCFLSWIALYNFLPEKNF